MAATKILLADASATVRNELSLTLSAAGFNVTEAVDAWQAIALLLEERFDMLLIDFNLPKMDGIRFISEVRRIPGHLFTPIILLSCESTGRRHSECILAGSAGFIQKPFHHEQVLGVLRMHMPKGEINNSIGH